MSSAAMPPAFLGVLRAARLRALLSGALLAAPPAAGIVLLLDRYTNPAITWAVAAAALILWTALALRHWRALDRRWLARGLNQHLPVMEDSADLLLGEDSDLPPLAALQRARLKARLEHAVLPDLRPPYPWRLLSLACLGGLALALLALESGSLNLALARQHTASVSTNGFAVTPRIHVRPPAYTGLPDVDTTTLDVKAPEGSALEFALHLEPAPNAASLVFADGHRLDLKRQDEGWHGSFRLDASALYRLDLGTASAADEQPLHTLEALPDRPPEVRVRAPDKTLNLLAPDQKAWELAFEASDDYGLGPAELSISLAQGAGDNVKTTERKMALEGRGDARRRSYSTKLDLAALGFARGDDLIVRLSVADNRQPQPNLTQSASFILRWPEQAMRQGAGVEGPIQNATPAYFRSERQLIIDTEALQGERGTLDTARFAARADALGVDQKMLRLRYGQFLGEEFEGNAEHDPRKEGQADEHEAGPPPKPGSQVFGKEGNTTAEYGHIHDIAEAATLLDPETRRILKSALDEMWQAELQLRQALPEQALPYEHKALDAIKQVQQAERIYLARAGLELPQPDPARRLSGDRAGLEDRSAGVPSAQDGDARLTALYRAAASGDPVETAVLQQWLQTHPEAAPAAMGLLSAADRLRREPACQSCRDELLAGLWPLLPPPPTAIVRRSGADAAGAAYLQALSPPASAAPSP